MACIHCGTTKDLIPRKNGILSGVCAPCRRAQKNANSRTRYSSPRLIKTAPRHVRPTTLKTKTENDRQAAIRRAQDKAKRLNIPLSEALASEGI